MRIDSSRQMGVFQPLLQHGVVIKVVVPQRLFDHQQVKAVEGHDMVGVAQPVRGVGVAAQGDARPTIAHFVEDFDIPAGLAFELDALIAGSKLPFDNGQQFGDRRLDAQGDAAGDGVAHSAQQPGKRHALSLRLEVPDRVFQRGLGHGIAANHFEKARTLRRRFQALRPMPA